MDGKDSIERGGAPCTEKDGLKVYKGLSVKKF